MRHNPVRAAEMAANVQRAVEQAEGVGQEADGLFGDT